MIGAPGVQRRPAGSGAARGKLWRRVVGMTLVSTVASVGFCWTMYYLIGLALFPGGTLGWTMILAPLVTPIVVAPLALVPLERSRSRVAALLQEVELTRAQLMLEVAERQAAQSKLEELVRRDPLTGLLNRRGLFDFWHASSGQNLVLFIVDVDNFKEVNDESGHAAGDEVLRAIAGALRDVSGDAACVARVGGDEFVVIAPASADGEETVRVRERLAALHVELGDGATQRVSASIGSAYLPRGSSIDDALSQADEQMYTAKRARFRGGPRSDGPAEAASAQPASTERSASGWSTGARQV